MEKKDEERNVSALMRMATETTSDDVIDRFICLICLELVHKPVVNACGHMFCFLCVHLAMNYESESYCPLCRRQYMHFPRICEQLHFFLLKALPDAYRRRCKEARAEEVQANVLSPQFDDGLELYLNNASGDGTSCSIVDIGTLSAATLEASPVEEDGSPLENHETCNGNCEGTSSWSSTEPEMEESSQLEVGSVDSKVEGVPGSTASIATSGLLCSVCNKLLCRPVVLNCGHAFCEGCVGSGDGAQDSVLKCSTCGSFHPGPFPSVFLELHHYLGRKFTSEYVRRQFEMDLKAAEREKGCNLLKQNLQPSNKQGDEPKFIPQRIHFGVGCDGCGIYPMTGRRFKCQDCANRPGYDLCLNCFESRTILVGRFNQKHTREHRMVEIGSRHHIITNHPSEIEDLGEEYVDDMEYIDDAEVNSARIIIGRIPTWNYPPNTPF